MSFAFVGEAVKVENSIPVITLSCTNSIAVQANDLIVVYIKWEDDTATISWAGDSDDSTNQLTVGTISAESNPYGCWAYRLIAQADASFYLKVTWNTAVSYPRIFVYVFRPDSGETVSLDGTYNLLHGTSGDPQSTNLTSAGNDVIAIGAYGEYASGTITTWQIGDVAADGHLDSDYLTMVWRKFFTSVPGSIHAQCAGGGDPWQCGIIAFKSEAAGGGGVDTAKKRMSATHLLVPGFPMAILPD